MCVVSQGIKRYRRGGGRGRGRRKEEEEKEEKGVECKEIPKR